MKTPQDDEDDDFFPRGNLLTYTATVLFWQAGATIPLAPLAYALTGGPWEWHDAPWLLAAVAIGFTIGATVAKMQIQDHPERDPVAGAKFVRYVLLAVAAVVWATVQNPRYGWAGILSLVPAFLTTFFRLQFDKRRPA